MRSGRVSAAMRVFHQGQRLQRVIHTSLVPHVCRARHRRAERVDTIGYNSCSPHLCFMIGPDDYIPLSQVDLLILGLHKSASAFCQPTLNILSRFDACRPSQYRFLLHLSHYGRFPGTYLTSSPSSTSTSGGYSLSAYASQAQGLVVTSFS